jgi:predicted transcriptional regulator
VSQELTYKAAKNVFHTRVDKESMLMNSSTEMCYQLNAVATQMWECLIAGQTIPQTVESISHEFNAPATTIEKDLNHLISDLQLKGLLCESSESFRD